MDKLKNSIYKYHTWLGIPDNTVKSFELEAPRIRLGPIGEEGSKIPALQISNASFSNVEVLNLSYQELAENYQFQHFKNILEEAGPIATVINIQHNNIRELKGCRFEKALEVHMQHNLVRKIADLPLMDQVEDLNLDDNCIDDLSGIEKLPHWKNQ